MMVDLTFPEQKTVWDRRNSNESLRNLPADPRVMKYVVDMPQMSRRALDIGCGNGRHLKQLADLGWRCTGLDWSNEAISQCRELLGGYEQQVRLMNEDYRKLSFSGNYFHLILAIDVIHHGRKRDLERAIAEIKRVKAISGKALITLPGFRNAPAPHQEEWIEEQTVILHSGLEAGIPHHFIKEEDIGNLFRTFRNVEAERVVLPMPAGIYPLHSMHENEWYWIQVSG